MNNLEKTEKTFKINNVKFMAVSIHSRNFAKGIYNVIIYPMSYYNYKNLIRTTLVSKNPEYAIEIAKEYNINKLIKISKEIK